MYSHEGNSRRGLIRGGKSNTNLKRRKAPGENIFNLEDRGTVL